MQSSKYVYIIASWERQSGDDVSHSESKLEITNEREYVQLASVPCNSRCGNTRIDDNECDGKRQWWCCCWCFCCYLHHQRARTSRISMHQWFMEYSCIDEDSERVAVDHDAMRYHHRSLDILIKPLTTMIMMMTMMLLAMVGLAKRTQNREWLPTTTSISFIRFTMIFDKYQTGARKNGQHCRAWSCVWLYKLFAHSSSISTCSFNHCKH